MAAAALGNALGRRCRELRRQRGLSQLDIVRQFEFSLSHYQKIERGTLDPRLSTLQKLAECYGVTLSEFLKLDLQEGQPGRASIRVTGRVRPRATSAKPNTRPRARKQRRN